jgi:hypothetical protein
MPFVTTQVSVTSTKTTHSRERNAPSRLPLLEKERAGVRISLDGGILIRPSGAPSPFQGEGKPPEKILPFTKM